MWLVFDNLKNMKILKLTNFEILKKSQFSSHSNLPTFEGNATKNK